jgi:ATP-dependent protease Clp ATPase subunit
MLEVMYELPSRKDVNRCVITREMVEQRSSAEPGIGLPGDGVGGLGKAVVL